MSTHNSVLIYLVSTYSEAIIQQLIVPGRKLSCVNTGIGHCTDTVVPLLFQESSLQEQELESNVITGIFPHENTNLKKLVITREFLYPPAMSILNITSLTFLQINEPLDRDLAVLAGIDIDCEKY